MTTISASKPRIDTSCAETGGMEINNYVRAMALALANQELRQRFQLIIQAYDLLAAGQDHGTGLLSEATRRVASTSGPVFSFGPFQLFPSQRLLLKGNRSVQLGGRAFDILTALVERAGEVVGKEELIARVWTNVFVEYSNLKTQVCALRRSLDAAGGSRRLIVTVPGRGYNFVAPVTCAHGRPPDGPDPWRADVLDHPYGEARGDKIAPMMSLPELIRGMEPCT